MPKPRKGESKAEFIPRCINYLVSQEGRESDQAAAICYSIWEDHSKSKKSLVVCRSCSKKVDYLSYPEKGMGYIECPYCRAYIDQEGKVINKKAKKLYFCKKCFILIKTHKTECSKCNSTLVEVKDGVIPDEQKADDLGQLPDDTGSPHLPKPTTGQKPKKPKKPKQRRRKKPKRK